MPLGRLPNRLYRDRNWSCVILMPFFGTLNGWSIIRYQCSVCIILNMHFGRKSWSVSRGAESRQKFSATYEIFKIAFVAKTLVEKKRRKKFLIFGPSVSWVWLHSNTKYAHCAHCLHNKKKEKRKTKKNERALFQSACVVHGLCERERERECVCVCLIFEPFWLDRIISSVDS